MNEDKTSGERKKDHIAIALKGWDTPLGIDSRFYYEPMLSSHPRDMDIGVDFLGKHMDAPIWVSSMTGGTAKAKTINRHLAMVCGLYGLGMGLGSCRSLLYDDERLEDFAVRQWMPDGPLYANLGIAQIEQLIEADKVILISELIKKLGVDGLVIHVNPLQEWMQKEGDVIENTPVKTIEILTQKLPDLSIIVKEVGQGMGIRSLKALSGLDIEGIEFSAAGGTNFSMIEQRRRNDDTLNPLTYVGHSALEMVEMVNLIGDDLKGKEIIISGGIRNFLDGYFYIKKMNRPAIYGQAAGFLRVAEDYEKLCAYVEAQIEGLKMCYTFLDVK